MNIEVLPYPPYPPTLHLVTGLCHTIKNIVRGRKFSSNEELKAAVRVNLTHCCSSGLHHVFDAWMKRWSIRIETVGSYFEKEFLKSCVLVLLSCQLAQSGNFLNGPRTTGPPRKFSVSKSERAAARFYRFLRGSAEI